MNSDTKKKIFIGLSVTAVRKHLALGIFIYNSQGEKSNEKQPKKEAKPIGSQSGIKSKPNLNNNIEEEKKKEIKQAKAKLDRDLILNILRKAKLNNFNLFKRICNFARGASHQMGTGKIEPRLVKSYLQSPDTPLKVEEELTKNYTEVCKSFNTTHDDFKESLGVYLANKDVDIQRLVDQIQSDYENSFAGKLPQVKVVIPADLTLERLLEIYKKLTLKRYLLQIDIFKKVRGKTQQGMMNNKELQSSLPDPEEEQNRILDDEGLGANDQPASAVYSAALTQFKSAAAQQFQKIDYHYAQSKYLKIPVFNRYKVKVQSNKITEVELNQLEDQLIYSESY